MSSFGPSEQQQLQDQQHTTQYNGEILLRAKKSSSRDELLYLLESELERNERLQQEVRELREEKVKLNLVLEEEDERRANMFLKKLEELENAKQADSKICPKCASIMIESSTTPRSRSSSIGFSATGAVRSMESLSEE